MNRLRIFLSIGLVVGCLTGAVMTFTTEPARAAGPVLAQNDNKKDDDKKGNNGNNQNQNGTNTQNVEKKGENVDPVSQNVVKDTSVVEYISDAYAWMALIGGLLAVIMIMYAGYTYMASSGDPEKIANAKDIVEKALIGLGLLITAAVILKTINPATVNPKANPKPGNIDFTKPGGGEQRAK